MNKLLLFLLLVLPFYIIAQPVAEDSLAFADDTISTGNSGILGALSINGITYTQIRLKPEFTVWKLGIGLDLDFLIDSYGQVRSEDWDGWEDIFQKIYYIRYAKREDPFYFKLINIDDYSLAQGLIFKGYNNTMLYPDVKNIGGFIGFNTNILGLGAEFFTHNILKNEVLGGRIQAKPLQFADIPMLSDLTFGLNAGLDRNQWGKYEDQDDDSIPDVYDRFPSNSGSWADTDLDGVADEADIDIDGDNNLDDPSLNPYVALIYPNAGQYGDNLDNQIIRDSLATYPDERRIFIYSADYKLPLVNSDDFELYNYGEIARIDAFGHGVVFPGMGARLSMFEANLEFRQFSDRFLPGYFDNLYDAQRSQYYTETDPITGRKIFYLRSKDRRLNDVKPSFGWYGSLAANIYNIAKLSMSFQDMYGDDLTTGKTLIARLSVDPKFIKHLDEASISYAQKNMPYIAFKKLRNTGVELGARLVYAIADSANLVGRYNEYYFDVNGDGKIEGKEEIDTRMSFGVEFKF